LLPLILTRTLIQALNLPLSTQSSSSATDSKSLA
jgi:hypothetical protein